MMRLLFSVWFLLTLCMVSCTRKNAEERQPKEDVTNASPSTTMATTTAEAIATPESAPAPEVVDAPKPATSVKTLPKMASAPKKVASASKAIVAVNAAPKEVSPSPVSPEPISPSESITYRPRSAKAGGYLCDSVEFIKYEKLHDGQGGFMRGKILARKSRQCGYVVASVSKALPGPTPTAAPTPVASQAAMPPPEQWIADALLPEKCENGILYKYEKSTQTGVSRKTKVGTCPVEAPKPDYLNKTIQQVKDDGLIKKGESGTRKKDN